eukprot:7995725-Pyramimonas_sp.AAC.1
MRHSSEVDIGHAKHRLCLTYARWSRWSTRPARKIIDSGEEGQMHQGSPPDVFPAAQRRTQQPTHQMSRIIVLSIGRPE